MRLMSFALGGEARFGAVEDAKVVDMTARLGPRRPSTALAAKPCFASSKANG